MRPAAARAVDHRQRRRDHLVLHEDALDGARGLVVAAARRVGHDELDVLLRRPALVQRPRRLRTRCDSAPTMMRVTDR